MEGGMPEPNYDRPLCGYIYVHINEYMYYVYVRDEN